MQAEDGDNPFGGAWHALQALLGSPEARSGAERREVEKAANREPWVHEVGGCPSSPGPLMLCRCLLEAGLSCCMLCFS